MSIRKGKIRKLYAGELARIDSAKPIVVSTSGGSKIYCPSALSVYSPTIFLISKTWEIPNIQYLRRIGLVDSLKDEFERYETEEVLRRMNNADDITFVKKSEVDDLKKLFKGLGKNVAVLPSGKIADLGKNFTLYVRTDAEILTSASTNNFTTNITIWENVGFSYELE